MIVNKEYVDIKIVKSLREGTEGDQEYITDCESLINYGGYQILSTYMDKDNKLCCVLIKSLI